MPGETGPPTSYITQSNSTGQFVMKDIEPGKYRLTVNRNGYVPFTYGASETFDARTRAYVLLKRHGQTLCKRSNPHRGRVLYQCDAALL
ncbi:MAG TPA: carboxypeptidase-like regulatory domain-containing protein [Candidatus Sulfotelmatobacter sp.]